MSLADRAKTPPQLKGPGSPCPINVLLTEKLDKADAKGLQTMLESPWRIWPHLEIHRVLEDEGHFIGAGAVGKHRRGTCRCAKQS